MAAKNIKSDDLILVNRGGVDYQAEVGELPIEDVDLDGYATEDWVEAKGYITSDEVPESETPDLEAVIAEGGVFRAGGINASGPDANYALIDTRFTGMDTRAYSEESGDGHDINSVRGFQLLMKDNNYPQNGGYRQTAKILTNGNAYFEGSVESGEFIGDGSKLTGVMPLDLRTLPALP